MILRTFVALVIGFLVAPLLIIVLFSFHATASLSFPFQGFSLRWYGALFEDAQLGDAMLTSLLVALVTAVATLFLGMCASLAWLRLGGRARAAVEAVTITPIALPGLFIGVSLLIALAMFQVSLGKVTIIIAHIVISMPIVMIAMRARLALFDTMLEEASRDLGANSLYTFRKVTLPLIMPTLVSAAVLTFAISLDEFIVTGFVSGTETTLPMFIWSMMRRTVTPMINAISTVILIATLAILLISSHIERTRRAQSLRARESE